MKQRTLLNLNQFQFSRHAESFVSSEVHRAGQSLLCLRELLDPKPEWRMLDIATGGGHTALAFSSYVREIVACDLSWGMLRSAREFLASESQNRNISVAQSASEYLPFRAEQFDCVTCRLAAHHFTDLSRFIMEVARTLKTDGKFGIADIYASGEPAILKYANAIERFRDPSHNWMYSLGDWHASLAAAGLEVSTVETMQTFADGDAWASRVGLSSRNLNRLKALLAQAPASAKEWLNVTINGARVKFSIHEAMFIGRKTSGASC